TEDGLQHPRRATWSSFEQQAHWLLKPGSPQEAPTSPQMPSAAPSQLSVSGSITPSPHSPGVGVGVGGGASEASEQSVRAEAGAPLAWNAPGSSRNTVADSNSAQWRISPVVIRIPTRP